MTNKVDNLIFEPLRGLQTQVESLRGEMRSEFSDVKHRIGRLESAMAGVRRDEARTAEDVARQQSALDRLKERMDRIERRLDLSPGE